MNYQELIQRVKEYIDQFYSSHPDNQIVYHNYEHTKAVVEAATQIGNHYQLNDHDFFVVTTAAYFHDLGYFICEPAEHETKSAEVAGEVLSALAVDEPTITQIKGCIIATRIPQQPNNLLEQIVCDADLFHFGTEAFTERNKLMRKEMSIIKHKDISKDDWRKGTIQFLESHHYHTDYAKLLLQKTKDENLARLKKKVTEKEQEKAAIPQPQEAAVATGEQELKQNKPEEQTKKEKGKEDKKAVKTDRGIETMFRVSSTNHQRLSDMADNKSQLLITVNSIIISVLLSVLLRKLDEYPHLTIPSFMLVATNVVTIVLAILATRPTIPPGTFTKEEIEEKKVNLLFFGNFYKMSLDEYAWGMRQVMGDYEFLYGSLIRDVYAQGVVLGKKYKLLRKGYNIFMFGIVISVIAFLIAVLTYKEA
ncbi:Pycsar system effector family protein [Foetidibacter luteolus]|uniref:Pycsar system effector family protein n=1 Tax=Foetidibacter luteolus TaxID=2608880 RepID=UPI00129B01E0|nr:Pycsar system effector family protein [Foetidibacter luteolus]